jgi:hypothetical protein
MWPYRPPEFVTLLTSHVRMPEDVRRKSDGAPGSVPRTVPGNHALIERKTDPTDMVQRPHLPPCRAGILVRASVMALGVTGALTLLLSGAAATTDSGQPPNAFAAADDTELSQDWMPVHGFE